MEKIKIENLSFAYPEQKILTLDNIDLTIEKGDFLLICGKAGCGKSTFLRQFKTALVPGGERKGKILFDGVELDDIDLRKQAAEIGFVQQSPENQIVTDKVWHELAFGPESLGEDTQTIRRRVAEMSSFFGLEKIFYSDTASLSGGQKQLLNLAAVMVMHPSVLILDEPTSQLDPIAASDFLAVLGKINRELGTTIILSEHRLEDAFVYANRIAYMDNGKIVFSGTPRETGRALQDTDYFSSLPSALQISAALAPDTESPVTVSEGSRFLLKYAQTHEYDKTPINDLNTSHSEELLHAEKLWFRYEQNEDDIIKGTDISLYKGEFTALLGGNGAGKTTLLKLLAETEKPYRGTTLKKGRAAMLPQDPQTLFVKKTIREDLLEVLSESDADAVKKEENIRRISSLCRIDKLLDHHPYDVSGGEQQRAALAKILLTEPDILLLDEPTKGMDSIFKKEFAKIIKELLSEGKSVLMVSHDIEFCAEHADKCALFFDGNITSSGTPHEFFSSNSFYTTASNRISRQVLPNAVTVADVVKAFGHEIKENLSENTVDEELHKDAASTAAVKKEKLPLFRKISAAVFAAISLFIFLYTAGKTDLSQLITQDDAARALKITDAAGKQFLIYCALILSILLTFLSVGKKSSQPVSAFSDDIKQKLSRRTKTAAAIILTAVPVTLFTGIYCLGIRKYNVLSIIILLECMLPFFISFEKKRPRARETAVIASLCAIAIAGRAAFFMLPQFKPVMAVTIIAGAAFGGETGFLVGAVSMLASNILFSQGPWTPWQMFAMGITGFIAGILFRKGFLKRNKTSLAVFGAASAIIIYGGIMNPAAAIIWSTEKINTNIILAYYISGFPLDCIHAFATAFFLMAASEPMLETLDRIKTKYGI